MIAGSNKERLEQEIANLIGFISDGREYFYRLTGNTIHSSDEMMNHFDVMELFQTHKELIQLDLNIQLLYIKLSSYFTITSKATSRSKGILVPRNAFAHDLADLVFDGRVKYNFFLYKVSLNFKKIEFLFYEESPGDEPKVKIVPLDLDGDINQFLDIWKNSK